MSGTSYALLTGSSFSDKEQIIKAGDVTLELSEYFENTNQKISVMSDTDGLLQEETYSFNLKNIGDVAARYDVKLVNEVPSDYTDEVIEDNYIEIGIEINGEEHGPFSLSEVNHIIDSGIIYENELISYEIRIWLNEDYEDEILEKEGSKGFYKIKVEAEQRINRDTYEVVYNSNGGQGEMSNSIFVYDENHKLKKNIFTREGYIFLGWSKNKDTTEAEYTDLQEVINLPVDNNEVVTLYAVWIKDVPTEYIIVYTLNGGVVTGNPTTYNKDSETFTLNNPTKEGYIFTGWTGSNGTTPQTTVTISKGSIGNKEYVANFKPKTYVIHSTGMYVTSDDMTVTYEDNKVINYKKPERKYTIRFNANDQNATISSLSDLTYEYEFDGFYLDSNTKLIDSDGNLVSNVSGYTDSNGKWIKDQSDIYVDDVYKGDKVYPELAPVITLPTVEKTGYTCNWNTNANGSGISYASGEKVSGIGSSIDLYAVCKANTYTITLDNTTATTLGSTSTVVTYGSSLLDITNPRRELTVNYDANNQGGTISSLDPVKVTEDFLGWYDSSNVQVINNNGEFVKNASGYTDSNGNWIRMSDASLRAVWTGRKQVTLSTINKIGHTCSWNTNMNGIGTSYNSGEVIYLGEDRTLYAVCKANTYTITYDSNSGSGCSGTKTVTYGEPIGELCTPSKSTNYMFVGWFDDSNALHDNSLSYKDHPWLYYADTYNDLYNAFGYDEDSLYTHYNENVTNGSENRRKSQYLASDTYNIAGNITLNAGWYKLWEGIPLGNYTLGQTVIYAGLEWTVVKDNGDNVGLARNNTFGQGDPADSGTILTQNYIPLNTVLTKDMNNGGLIDQGNGEYATTNSGISLGYSGFNYFTDQSHFYNTNTRNRLELVSGSYIRGGSSVRGGANLPIEYYDSSYKTVETIDPGIKSIASDDWTVDKVNSTVTFKDIAATYTTTSDYYSTVLTRFNMKSHSNCTPSSTTLCYTDSRFNVVNGAFEISSSEALMGSTARINVKVCGGTWNDKSIVYQYKDANSFYYGNEYTGTGWSSSGFNASYSMNYILNSQNIIANYAGGISINCSSGLNCTSTTVGSVNRYIRNYYLSDSDNCQQVRRYTLEDRTYDIYFRPYIIVRER